MNNVSILSYILREACPATYLAVYRVGQNVDPREHRVDVVDTLSRLRECSLSENLA